MRPRRLLWMGRVLLYRLRWRGAFSIDGFGLAVGKNVSITVQRPGSMRIGRDIQLRDGCEVWALGGDVEIGANVFVNRNCSFVARRGVAIGSDCLFGPNVAVYDHDHGFGDRSRPMWEQDVRAEPIRIGSNVWVGANAVITAGAEIADWVVVGANSVVTKSLPESGVYAGNPATLVRPL